MRSFNTSKETIQHLKSLIKCGPKPKLIDIVDGNIDAEVVVCLLGKRERQELYRQTYVGAGITCFTFDKSAFQIHLNNPTFNDVGGAIAHFILKETTMYIHCNQGVHRTSSAILNALHQLGYPSDWAVEVYSHIRPDLNHELESLLG